MTVDHQDPHEEDSNQQPSENDRMLAILALQLHKEQKPNGLKPSMEEIWAWMHGEVGEPRSTQIKSHIARDPDVYSLWHELRTTRSELESLDTPLASAATVQGNPAQNVIAGEADSAELTPDNKGAESGGSFLAALNTLRGWIQPRPLAGFATAVIVGGVFFKVMQPDPTVDYWQDWQTPKSSASSAAVEEDADALRSVLAGMNSAMRELSLPATGPYGEPLPGQTPVCPDTTEGAACTATREALHELGQLVVEVRLICLTSYPVPESKRERLSSVAEVLVGTKEGRPFEGPVLDWLESEEDQAQCSAVNTIVERALRALGN